MAEKKTYSLIIINLRNISLEYNWTASDKLTSLHFEGWFPGKAFSQFAKFSQIEVSFLLA